MKITKISKAKGYRIFRDFSWPSNLNQFGKYNLIYGWNGVGKTSLSNIFKAIQLKSALLEGEVEVVVNGRAISGADFSVEVMPDVRVFNRDTVQKAVFEVAGQQLPPVFFLGEDSVDKQKKIEALKVELAEAKGGLEEWSSKMRGADAAFDSFCTDQARSIKNLLTAAGGAYNNFNAAAFKAEMKLLEAEANISALPEEEKGLLLSMKDQRAMEKIGQEGMTFPNWALFVQKADALLAKSVVSSVMQELVDDKRLASWVGEGLRIHSDGEGLASNCKFCLQPLPTARVRSLEGHFNDAFKELMNEIDSLYEEIESARKSLQSIQVPSKERFYEGLRADYEKSRAKCHSNIGSVGLALDALMSALRIKRDEPFRIMSVSEVMLGDRLKGGDPSVIEMILAVFTAGASTYAALLGANAFAEIRAIIGKHNAYTDRFYDEVKEARQKLARDELLTAMPRWNVLKRDIAEAEDRISVGANRQSDLFAQISDLEIAVREHRRPAEELNKEIASYLGRDELRFEVEDNGYRIMRSGQPAMNLSEGERTAIAFLYFLKSLQGSDFDMGSGVVVVDDPVSSLDTNSIFSAFGFMKQRIESAGQIFILTHNFMFFRQVRNWFRHAERKIKKAGSSVGYYMVACDLKDGIRRSTIQKMDAFLLKYESEYQYLFKKIYEESQRQHATELEACYSVPNMARRVLEAFLAFKIPDQQGELYDKLREIDFDTAKKSKILRFVHTFSHADQVADPDHDLSVLSETPAILRDVLEMIRHCDEGHYLRMVELIDPAGRDGAEVEMTAERQSEDVGV